MCNFLSALVMRNGDVFTDPFTDSHDELLLLAGITEASGNECCRVEFTPGDNIADPAGYTLKVDEQREPEWFADVREIAERKLRARVSAMVVRDQRQLLHNGAWILTDGAVVGTCKWCRLWIRDSATVDTICESAKVGYIRGSATVDYICGSAKVSTIRDSATVDTIGGSATVDTICESATVGTIRDSATVDTICESAKVGYIRGSATVDYICGSAKVGTIRESATVDTIGDSATVDIICDSATVGYICDSAKVGTDNRGK